MNVTLTSQAIVALKLTYQGNYQGFYWYFHCFRVPTAITCSDLCMGALLSTSDCNKNRIHAVMHQQRGEVIWASNRRSMGIEKKSQGFNSYRRVRNLGKTFILVVVNTDPVIPSVRL